MLDNEPLLEGESRLYCSSVYHLVRLNGLGSDYVLPLYDLSMRVGHESGRFFARMTEIAPYLSCGRNQLYNAAARLVESGFWECLVEMRGKATEYRPLSHEDWVTAHSDAVCCKKAAMPWDGEEQDPLGKQLYAVTGGAKFWSQHLKGWRRKSGLTDDQIVARAKEFMDTAGSASSTKGSGFHMRLGAFICKKL